MNDAMKTCTKCGETKPLSEFSADDAYKDGYQSHCKACKNAYQRARYAKNRERELARVKAWHEKNPGKMAEYRKKAMQDPERRAKSIAKVTAWASEHPEAVKKAKLRQTQKRYLEGSKKRWWPD